MTRLFTILGAALLLGHVGCGGEPAQPAAKADPQPHASYALPTTPTEVLDRAIRLRPPASVFVGHALTDGRFVLETPYTGSVLEPGPGERCARPAILPATLQSPTFVAVLGGEQRTGRLLADAGCVRDHSLSIHVQTDGADDGAQDAVLVAGRPVVPTARFEWYFEAVAYDDALRTALTAAVRPSLPPTYAPLVDETPLIPVVHAVAVADDCPRIAILDAPLVPNSRNAESPVVAAIYCLGPDNAVRAPVLAPIAGLRARFVGAVDLDGDGLQTIVLEITVGGEYAPALAWDWIIERDPASRGFVELGSGRRTDLAIADPG